MFSVIAILVCFAVAVPAEGSRVEPVPVIHLAVFRSPSCGHCDAVEKLALEKLGSRLGVKLAPHYYNIDNLENYKLLLAIEKDCRDEDNEFPVSSSAGASSAAKKRSRSTSKRPSSNSPKVATATFPVGVKSRMFCKFISGDSRLL